METTLTLFIHQSEDGRKLFWAESPNYPGCFTEGRTMAETVRNWGESLAAYIESYDDPADAYVPTPTPATTSRRRRNAVRKMAYA